MRAAFLYDEETITVTVTSTTLTRTTKNGVDYTVAEAGLLLMASPNPSTYYFTLVLRSNSSKAVNLQVFNELGQVVAQKRGIAPNGTVRVRHRYTPGTYLVQVQQGDKKVFVKMRRQ